MGGLRTSPQSTQLYQSREKLCCFVSYLRTTSNFIGISDNYQIQHDFFDIIFLVISGLLSQAEGWKDIEYFGHKQLDRLRKYRCLANDIPSQDTIARIVSLIPPDLFQACYLAWINSIRQAQEIDIITIDGNTLKHSYHLSSDKLSALHSVSAYATERGITLLQKKSQAKKNEVAAVLSLIDELEITGSVITADAMSCLKKVTHSTVKKEADYVLQLKANQSKLLEEKEGYFHKVRRKNPKLIGKCT